MLISPGGGGGDVGGGGPPPRRPGPSLPLGVTFALKNVVIWTLLYIPWFPVIAHASRIPSPLPREVLNRDWWTWRLESLAAGNEHLWVPVSLGSWAFWLLVVIGIFQPKLRIASFMFIGGSILEVLLLQIHPHFSAVRYLLPSTLAAFILAGGGFAALMRYWPARPVAIAAVILFAGHALLSIDEFHRGHSDWRTVAAYVHDRVKPGDRIEITNGWVERNFGYYFDKLPRVENVSIDRYAVDGTDLFGPAWVVTGGCMPHEAGRVFPLMARFPWSEQSEVRYLRTGHKVARVAEVCPE
jgi:hypothetical protein